MIPLMFSLNYLLCWLCWA